MVGQRVLENGHAERSPRADVAASRPIDLAHLSRQTMGDRSLEQEVLRMFVRQALAAKTGLALAANEERARLAHALKGSARSIGAFRLAECLGAVEEAPTSVAALRRLSKLIDEVANFVAAIGR